MWTHKRVVLLLIAFAGFVSAYVVYAQLLGLGAIDGLPPLPADFGPCVYTDPLPPRPENVADQRLRQAFGEECPELKRALKLEVRKRGAVVAADYFTILDDGRVKVQPFSVAMFGKTQNPGQPPEINTIRSDVAYLTFDRPITSPMEINHCNLTGAELEQDHDSTQDKERHGDIGGVLIVNNRKTPQRDDDLSLFTTGPVYYQESLHRIWTKEAVKLTDMQSKPKPTIVTATGMDLYLTTEAPPPANQAKAPAPAPASRAAAHGNSQKQKNTTVTGVERVVLRADVSMFLYMDGQSGFMSSGKPKPDSKERKPPAPVAVPAAASATAKAPVPEKDKVVIQTQGPFEYLVETDFARFDISQHPGPYANHVEVTRQYAPAEAGGPRDYLVCDHLELQFRRKNAKPKPAANGAPAPPAPATPAAPAAADDRSVDLEIERAHATGKEVILTSDSEMLEAHGNDLVYDAQTHQSIIKGEDHMQAVKDGHLITARELVLMGIGAKDAQQATAKGPGRIEMLDAKTGQRSLHATWKDLLVSNKEGTFDVLTLTGAASFEDKENGQLLQADVLKVWLEPGDDKSPAAAPAPAAASAPHSNDVQHRRPHHLDARGNVLVRSPSVNVQDTEHFVAWFKDVVPETTQLPAALPPASPPAAPAAAPASPSAAAPPASPSAAAPLPEAEPARELGNGHAANKPPSPEPPITSGPLPATAASSPDAAKPADGGPAKPQRPIDLSARFVEAFVLRSVNKNDLDKLRCEGNVRVRQEPASPEDKGVDIRGQTLQLAHFVEGNVLLVTGDLAEVHLDKLSILGPEVNIDQKENRVWVNGIGAMRMPSSTTFQGDKLSRPSEMTVHWNRNMFFNGMDAQFYGGIQAEQDSGRLACQTMQVFLDRLVSLKEGDKGKQPAKVEKLVCDKNVRIEDTKTENGRLESYTRLDMGSMVSDNPEGIVIGSGPGVVRILQYGTKDGLAAPGGTANAKPAAGTPRNPDEQELKLTRITYLGRMWANNNSRTAIFYDNVEVVNVPSDNPDLAIDLDRLPQGGLYMRCEQLKVYSQRDKDGKAVNQQMEAHHKAVVQSREFWGRADVIKYDESKEQVIFEASEGNLATLFRVLTPGQQPDEIRGKKIIYWRRTNDFKVEGATTLKGVPK